jgi:hypothetical protein
MGIRQWFNRAAKKAGKSWIRSYKKKWAEKRARKKQRQLEREIDTAMTRTPIMDRLPEASVKPVVVEDDDWFAPIAPSAPAQ